MSCFSYFDTSEEKWVCPKQPSASLLSQLSNESASHFCDGTKMREDKDFLKKKMVSS